MKFTVRLVAIAFLLTTTLVATTGCRTVPTAPEAPQAYSNAAIATTALGLQLFENLEDADENVVYSPVSISAALAMTHAGARGDTARQILETLNFEGDGQGFHRAFGALTRSLSERDSEGLKLRLANSLWIQGGLSYGIDFLEVLEREYSSEMRQVDFASEPEAAREVINTWVEERTEELISELLPQGVVTADTRLVLVNALYFKGAWASPFQLESTRPGSFRTPEGTVEVPLMRQQGRFRHQSTAEKDVIELPYQDNEFSMVLVVPREGTPSNFLRQATPESLATLMESLESGTVNLSMPRFNVRSPINLSGILAQMGMPMAFDPDQADFAPITRDLSLYLSAVVHEATITVDESGTEAAAATAAIIGITSAPTEVTTIEIDRPFVFFLRHQETGAVLFMGQVVDPNSGR